MWQAIYKNGETLEQFSNGKENMFSKIDQDNLKFFIVNSIEGYQVSVNFSNGDINVDGQVYSFDINTKPRLIYFKRNYCSFTMNSELQFREVYEHVGWQTTTKEGTNKKVIFGLYKDKIKVTTE